MIPQIVFLVGPPGSGKSEIAVKLAKELNGEIISCDSMLVYRGMNIGTAKLTLRERGGVRHRLIDLKNPRQHFTVSEYRKLALQVIDQILKRNHLPIVVGGSGLYVQALIDGLVPETGKTKKIRTALEKKLEKYGWKKLFRELKSIDPERASEILPGDGRRIVRSLEIYEAYKIKPSIWRKKRVGLNALGFDWVMIGLMRERPELYGRINQRVMAMIEKGLIREVKYLSKSGLSKTACQAIGYSEILAYLKGRMSLEEAILTIQTRSRHLAKKQLTWFRKDKRIHWIEIGDNDSLNKIVKVAVNFLKNKDKKTSLVLS